MHENPYVPPLADGAPPEPACAPVLAGDGARLCSSVGRWMRIAGAIHLALGVIGLVPGWRMIGFMGLETWLGWLWWFVPELLLVAAGIWLLRAGGALTRVGAGDGASTLRAAFANLRWHLLAVALAPLLQLGALLDPWEVFP